MIYWSPGIKKIFFLTLSICKWKMLAVTHTLSSFYQENDQDTFPIDTFQLYPSQDALSSRLKNPLVRFELLEKVRHFAVPHS